MAQERRQFIKLTAEEAENFSGLDGEFTYDSTNSTVRVHTNSKPHGISLATKQDIAYLQSQIDSGVTSDWQVGVQLVSLINEDSWSYSGSPAIVPYNYFYDIRLDDKYRAVSNSDNWTAIVNFSREDLLANGDKLATYCITANNGGDPEIRIYATSPVRLVNTYVTILFDRTQDDN